MKNSNECAKIYCSIYLEKLFARQLNNVSFFIIQMRLHLQIERF